MSIRFIHATAVLLASIVCLPDARADGIGGTYFKVQFEIRGKGWQDPEGRFDTAKEAHDWGKQMTRQPSSHIAYKVWKHTPSRPTALDVDPQTTDYRKGVELSQTKPGAAQSTKPKFVVRSSDEDALAEYQEFIKTVPGWREAIVGPNSGTPSSPAFGSTGGKAYNPPKDIGSGLLDNRPPAPPVKPEVKPRATAPKLDATRTKLVEENSRIDREKAQIEDGRKALVPLRERLTNDNQGLINLDAQIRKANGALENMRTELANMARNGSPSITSPAYADWAARNINLKSDIRKLEGVIDSAVAEFKKAQTQHNANVADFNRVNDALNARSAQLGKDIDQYNRDREDYLRALNATMKDRNAPGDHTPGRP